MISFGLSFSAPVDKPHQYDAKEPQPTMNTIAAATDIDILLLMDHEYGSSCTHIIERFIAYGWSVTIASTNETLTPYYCGPTITPDMLISEIDDVTEYDAISIMPGHGHEIMRTDETALTLIRDAVDAGLIVSAWCRAVRVLAAADVLDGKNITSLIDSVPVNIIISLSIPIPIPEDGGMPYSIASI